MNTTDFIGRRFGWLVVEAFDHADGKRSFWRCRCGCGTEKVISRDVLRNARSCGCKKSAWLYNPHNPFGHHATPIDWRTFEEIDA